MATATCNSVVLQRKAGAPLGGSHNPFDDFDVFTAADALARESVDSDYAFLFESPSNQGSTGGNIPGGEMRKSSICEVAIPSEDDDEQEDEDRRASSSAPARPSRTTMPIHWTAVLNEPIIPWASNDTELYKFVQTPFEERCGMRMTMVFDPTTRSFTCVQSSTKRTILIAQRRTDGLKSIALSANYTILLAPGDRSSSPDAVKIGKLRSNALCSQYSLFDLGKNPGKAAGIIEVRRELMSVKFECVTGIYTRRATYCVLPKPGQTRRPVKSEDTLQERWKKRDESVLPFSPFMPNTVPERLPRLEDFEGFCMASSVKNTMLHDPQTKQVVFRLGRYADNMFNLEFTHPFSVSTAFGLAVACCDSKVHPRRQL